MSLQTFIPRIWSARLLENLHKATVFAQVVNNDYEGDISQFGDRVQISAIGAVTISSYTKNTDMSSPQILDGAATTLIIDQSKAYNFSIDDIDKRQQQPKVMDGAMREAAYGLANDMDTYIAGLYTDAALTGSSVGYALGTDGSPLTVDTNTSHTNAYELLVDLRVALDANNVPAEGRWVVVPPWLYGLLTKDVRFSSYGTPANRDTAATGQVGDMGGFRIFVSNNVHSTTDTKYKVLAGYPGSITLASQIMEPEAFRSQKQFADVLRGLHLYGAKVVRPSALACATVNHA